MNILPVMSNAFEVTEGYILNSDDSGLEKGFISGSLGSITPATFGGYTITGLYTKYGGGNENTGQFSLDNTGLAQDFFTSIDVLGVTKLSADATYGSGVWTWTTGLELVTGTGTLPVTIV